MIANRPPERRARASESLFDKWEALHTPPPDVLFHYTTAAGLLAMVNSGHVWATESRYLNDPREFLHGAELILKVVDGRLARKRAPALEQLRDAAAIHIEEKLQNARIFCVSFCTDGDLLSQWRGYGDTGGGYALGFAPRALFGLGEWAQPPLRALRRVIYDAEEQRQLVEAWMDGVASGELADGIGTFWRFFSEAVITFKDEAYREEGEWRLVQFGRAWLGADEMKHPVRFRERKGKIIPYADLDLTKSEGPFAGRLPITEVVHGPTQDLERSGKALRLLLETSGYSAQDVNIRWSKVPFTG